MKNLESFYIFTFLNFVCVSIVGMKHSTDELPTLLHFACKYNLNTLAVEILDTPGAIEALDIVNCENMSPLDIAEQMENNELVNYIEVLLVSDSVFVL